MKMKLNNVCKHVYVLGIVLKVCFCCYSEPGLDQTLEFLSDASSSVFSSPFIRLIRIQGPVFRVPSLNSVPASTIGSGVPWGQTTPFFPPKAWFSKPRGLASLFFLPFSPNPFPVSEAEVFDSTRHLSPHLPSRAELAREASS